MKTIRVYATVCTSVRRHGVCHSHLAVEGGTINQSINQSCIFRVVQVIKSLQDALEVRNNSPGVNDNVGERGLERKCF